MIGRRAFFGQAAGAVVASAAVGKEGMVRGETLGVPVGSVRGCSVGVDPDTNQRAALLNQVMDQAYARNRNRTHVLVPQDIEERRSWSPAFKRHLAVQMERESRAFMDRLREDDAFLWTTAKAMGIKEPDL